MEERVRRSRNEGAAFDWVRIESSAETLHWAKREQNSRGKPFSREREREEPTSTEYKSTKSECPGNSPNKCWINCHLALSIWQGLQPQAHHDIPRMILAAERKKTWFHLQPSQIHPTKIAKFYSLACTRWQTVWQTSLKPLWAQQAAPQMHCDFCSVKDECSNGHVCVHREYSCVFGSIMSLQRKWRSNTSQMLAQCSAL